MIGRLTGHVVERSPGAVVLDVSGVGYELQIPLSTFYRLGDGREVASTLWVHTYLREDALVLYGFSTRDERGAFQELITVSGVGPRIALAVLSGLEVDDLRRVIEAGDRALLERIPGVGRKTAERILLELRDRSRDPKRKGGRKGTREDLAQPGVPGDVRSDAMSALANLGYPADAAGRAVEAALRERGERAVLEDVLKAALRGLVR